MTTPTIPPLSRILWYTFSRFATAPHTRVRAQRQGKTLMARFLVRNPGYELTATSA